MENKHLVITHAYHFLSESIIIFLAILPIMFQHYEGIPYLVYVGISVVICVLFSLYDHFELRYIPFILSLPMIIVVFYVTGYPISLSIIFAGLLTWRYLAIRSELYLKREALYIILTFVLAIGIFAFIQDIQALILVFFQLIIVVFGNLLSHMAVLEKADKRPFNRNFWVTFGGMFSAIAVGVFLMSDIVGWLFVKLYYLFGDLLVFIAGSIASIIPDDFDNDSIELIEEMEGAPIEEEVEEGVSIFHLVATAVNSYLIISLLIVAIGLLLLILAFRSRIKIRKAEQEEDQDYVVMNEKNPSSKSFFSSPFFRRKRRKFDHPVRKMIYDFERNAYKHNQGRHSFETIEEWLTRIGFTSDLEVYQKVRYAGMDVSDIEVEKLVQDIKEIEMNFKEQKDES